MMSHDSSANVLLSLKGIRKSFGVVKALVGVDLEVRRGEVHGLIGENGAGKSTLVKTLSGAHPADSGDMAFCGKPYEVSNPAEARAAGIAMIYQELNLAPHLTVEENIILGIEESKCGFVRQQKKRVRDVLEWMGHGEIDTDRAVGLLSISLQQVVEIARALVSDAKLIIMDEPTSSLSAGDAQALFRTIRRLRDKGISLVYISHFLEEVTEVCDSYTALRDGASVATGDIAGTTIKELIEHMVGRSIEDMYPLVEHTVGEPVLTVESLNGSPFPRGVSFVLRRGEILGLAGLVGSGRSEIVRCLFGLDRVDDGAVSVTGRPEINAFYLSPARALNLGFDLLSEDRKGEGLATDLPITANVSLSALKRYRTAGFLRLGDERRAAQEWCRTLSIKCRHVDDPVSSLSGGNQQKVAIARLLHHDSDILFLDEPTRGIDVGSKVEIYHLIQQLVAKGKAVVIISSYLPEVLGITDSLAVMHRGMMSPVRATSEWTEHDIMLYATSGD